MLMRHSNVVLSTLVFAVATAAAAQNLPPTHAASVGSPLTAHTVSRDATYGKRSMTFEPNRGQTDASVQFLSHGSNYSVLLEPAQATLVMHAEKGTAAERRKARMTGGPRALSEQVVSMSLAGADAAASVTGEQALPGYVNYISGADRTKDRTGIPTFAAVRAHHAYPGIDLLYYGTERQLEYDFVVAPIADPAQIKLRFAGAHPVLTPDGALHLQRSSKAQPGDMSFLKPVIYQQRNGRRESVDGSFAVAKNGEVSFHVGPYDHARELVIDPILSYASYFGGSGEDEINASTLNSANQLYAVGQTRSLDLPATAGEFQSTNVATATNNNFHSGFVTKFSADGSSVLWTTYLSGAGDSVATGVAVNAADQPYVVGYTQACGDGGKSYQTPGEFPFTADAVQPLCNPDVRGFNNYESNGASYDAILVKLSSDGKSELYGTPLGGTANDFASSVTLDASGKVYIVGETVSTQYLSPGVNSRSAPIPNYVPGGSIGTANYPTTSNAFYTNTTESRMNASVQGSGDTVGPQDEQAFLTVLSTDLHSFVYSSLIGGPVLGTSGNGTSATNGIAVAVNANGIAFIGGNTSSASFPVTTNAFAPTCSADSGGVCNLNGWLAAFDPTKSGTASRLFSTYITGTSAGQDSNSNNLRPGSDVFGLAVDSAGNVIATGDTNANNFPTTAGSFQPACITHGDGNGDSNVCGNGYLTKLSPTGATVWSTYIHGTSAGGGIIGQGVAVDATGNVYVVGLSGDNSLPFVHPINATTGGGDAVLFEFNPNASQVLMGTYLGTGGGITLNNNSLSLDTDQSAYFSGSQGVNPYGGTSFPVTPNAFDKVIQGTDGFVVKIITQQQPSATTLTVSPSGNVTPTQTVTLTASVVSTSTLTSIPTKPTGTVQFLNGTTVLGTGTIAAGVATFTGMLPAGNDSLTAVYAGDSGFNGSTSSATNVVVSSAVATSTTLTVNPSTATFGQAITLSSTTVAGTTPVTAGTVTFTAGTLTLGTANVGANGVATTNVTPAVGTYSVVANFSGTVSPSNPTGTGSSVSAGQSLTISKAVMTPTLSVTASPNPLIIQHGHSGVLTLTLTPTGGFAGTVSFGCGTLPQFVTCVFAPPTLVFTAASSAVQTDTLTIYTNPQLTAFLTPQQKPGQFSRGNAGSLAMLFWLPGSALVLFGLRRREGARLFSKQLKSLLMLALVVSGLGVAGSLSGCGGSNSNPTSATPGTYAVPLTITGTDGSVETVNVSIIVQ